MSRPSVRCVVGDAACWVMPLVGEEAAKTDVLVCPCLSWPCRACACACWRYFFFAILEGRGEVLALFGALQGTSSSPPPPSLASHSVRPSVCSALAPPVWGVDGKVEEEKNGLLLVLLLVVKKN